MRTNVMQKQQFVNPNLTRLEIAHNALNRAFQPRTRYFIEDADIVGNQVSVTYIEESILNAGDFSDNDWKEGAIKLDDLKAFVLDQELNIYFIDTSDHEGCHQQVSGCIPMDTYLSDNLKEAVGAYLYAGKEINNV